MASFWFLTLLLKCVDFLSWPVLALGYPLCISIEAIENDNHSDIRNLISYWILLSLMYLFEYAFLGLLQWFQYWHYTKLMIVAFLVMPDFGRASYVYNHLIRSCIYMNPQAVISRFRNWNKIFVKKEDFIMQAEKYITQNGTEALEKLIASKQSVLHAETRKADPTAEKNEILKTNRGSLLMEQKDIRDLEMIEDEQLPEGKQVEQLPEGKQVDTALCSLKSNESTSSAMAKTEEMAVDTEGGTYPQVSASENVQKEWTCAICQLTMPSEANLNSHLQGRRHKAFCEALNTKPKAKTAKETGGGASSLVSGSKNEQETKWTCGICQRTFPSEANLKSHMYGKKHKAKSQRLAEIVLEQEQTINTSNALPQKNSCRIRCEMCNVNCSSESVLASHLQGKKHLAQSQLQSGMSQIFADSWAL